jgi:hypothetical protein
MTDENNDMKILLETVNQLTSEIQELKMTKIQAQAIKDEPTIDPLEQEKTRIQQENAIRKEIEDSILFEKTVQSFNEDWGKVAENEHDIATIDKLNASNEYKLAKKIETIFAKEENKQILSKDMLKKFEAFQGLQEDDKHKAVKNIAVEIKSNFFENLEKLEIQKARLIQNGAIKDENKRPIVDKLVDRALNNPKIKAIK